MVTYTFEQFGTICNRIASGYEQWPAKSLQKIGTTAKTNIKNNSPVDTGYMKEHVDFEMINPLTLKIFSEAYYSNYVDKGHRTRSGSQVPANPFFSREIDRLKQGELLRILQQDYFDWLRSNFR